MRAPYIYLIGFMGAGKTTFGRILAKTLSYAFFDLDEQIERGEKKTIADIFEHSGETGFRLLESNYLKTVPRDQPFVLATGGGTPCFFDHIHWMNAHGVTVYLQLSAQRIARRLESSTTIRPLLHNKKGKALEAQIRAGMLPREVFYQQASIKVKGENVKPEVLIKLLDALPVKPPPAHAG